MHNYRNLQIWQDSMAIVRSVYEIVATFPQMEKFGLVSQMTRSAVSIPSNIAEGAGRSTNKEFSHFLSIAIGSMFELETQILIAESVGFLDNAQSLSIQDNLHKLQRMSVGFMKNLEKSVS